MITIQEILTKKEFKQFVKFPFQLYKNNKYWVPPIISDEIAGFDKTINPVFEHADAHFFLAYQNNQVVGRVAAIINWTEINEQKIKKMRFGWFDTIDNIEVTKALLNKVNKIGKQNNLEFIEGPVGFSNMDKVGVLTDGFDQLSTMITWYHNPYQKNHLEELGFKKAKRYVESYFLIKNIDISNYKRLAKIVKHRNKLTALNFTSTKQILPYVYEMFALFNISYAKLASFVPISNKQISFFKEKYITMIDPEFIKFVVDESGKLVSFAITMPSFAEALQKAKGKLFPTGFIHLIQAKKNNKDIVFFLIGILPEYQKKGVTAIIFEEFYKTCIKKGIEKAIRTPELEENTDIHLLWKNFKPVTNKRRSTYKKNIV